MAFNWPVFKTRALTAIVFAAVMLVGLFWNHWSFLVLFTLIHFGCWHEYLALTAKINAAAFHAYTRLGFMLAGYGLMLWCGGPVYEIAGYSVKESLTMPVSAAGFILLIAGVFNQQRIQMAAFGMAAAGVVYISLGWGLMMNIAGMTGSGTGQDMYNRYLPALIIFSIWINDTMAYITGSLVGKTPFSPISPKKTWEGTIGGIILCTGVIFLLASLFNIPAVTPVRALVIALAAGIAGTAGDLFESLLKRKAGVKDSGSLMPGHGGFLDRFDSLLFAVPVCWILLKVISR